MRKKHGGIISYESFKGRKKMYKVEILIFFTLHECIIVYIYINNILCINIIITYIYKNGLS